MLRTMGWRQGRGVSLATNKERRGRGGDDDFDRSELSRVGKGVELSAEDGEVVEMQTVEGTHGLGYTGMSTTMDERFGHTESALKNKGKGRGMRGQAFGVGAFEDEDDNVYTNVDLSQYDFALGGGGRGPETQSAGPSYTMSLPPTMEQRVEDDDGRRESVEKREGEDDETDEILEVVTLDIGSQPPPKQVFSISAITILKYLKEDLKKNKKEKKHKKDKRHKHKKDKKEKQSKKEKKEQESKKENKSRDRRKEHRRRERFVRGYCNIGQ